VQWSPAGSINNRGKQPIYVLANGQIGGFPTQMDNTVQTKVRGAAFPGTCG